MLKREKTKEMAEGKKEKIPIKETEDIVMYLMSYEIYSLIKRLDFNYKDTLEAKTTKMIGQIYQVLWGDDNNEIKLRNIYEIFEKNEVYIGDPKIRIKNGKTKSDA